MFLLHAFSHLLLSSSQSIHYPSFLVTGCFCCSVTKSCLTLCDPKDCSLPCSSVHRFSQARIVEWVAISSSRGSSWPRDWTHVSCISCVASRFFVCWATGEANLYREWPVKESCTVPSASAFSLLQYVLVVEYIKIIHHHTNKQLKKRWRQLWILPEYYQQNSKSDNFLKVSCNVESEIILIKFFELEYTKFDLS